MLLDCLTAPPQARAAVYSSSRSSSSQAAVPRGCHAPGRAVFLPWGWWGTVDGAVLPSFFLVGKATCPTILLPLKTVASVPRSSSLPASRGDLCGACPAWKDEDNCHRVCSAGTGAPEHPGCAPCRQRADSASLSHPCVSLIGFVRVGSLSILDVCPESVFLKG